MEGGKFKEGSRKGRGEGGKIKKGSIKGREEGKKQGMK
jgi:hypothetical protein